MCIHLLAAGFVCALKTNFLIRTSDKKFKNISVRELSHRLTLTYYCLGTIYRPRNEIVFSKIQRRFALQHNSNYTATKRKVCLGPLGSCLTKKSVRQNVLPNCWDFFAEMGGGIICPIQACMYRSLCLTYIAAQDMGPIIHQFKIKSLFHTLCPIHVCLSLPSSLTVPLSLSVRVSVCGSLCACVHLSIRALAGGSSMYALY